jgi:hypothetical protein
VDSHKSISINPANELEAHKEPLSLPRAEESRAAIAGTVLEAVPVAVGGRF